MSEPISSHPQVSTWLAHIRALAVEIGPRGPTRAGEREGALYAKEQFNKNGLHASQELFRSARSIFHPHLLGSGLILLAFILYPLGGKTTVILAALISAFALACELLELSFINNPFRWVVPKGESQNVYAVIPPAGEHKRDLVLVGHLDSQRTPLIFKSPRWVSIYDRFTTVVLPPSSCRWSYTVWQFSSTFRGPGTSPLLRQCAPFSWGRSASRLRPLPSPQALMITPAR